MIILFLIKDYGEYRILKKLKCTYYRDPEKGKEKRMIFVSEN